MSFVDEYTTMLSVYLFKAKSDVFKKFKKFINYVEKQGGRKLKSLRTNGGGKYNSTEFRKYCEEHRLDHEER